MLYKQRFAFSLNHVKVQLNCPYNILNNLKWSFNPVELNGTVVAELAGLCLSVKSGLFWWRGKEQGGAWPDDVCNPMYAVLLSVSNMCEINEKHYNNGSNKYFCYFVNEHDDGILWIRLTFVLFFNHCDQNMYLPEH